MGNTGSTNGRYHGGMVFYGNPDQALDRFTRIASATLGDYGHPVERQSILDRSQARIVTSHYTVKLNLAEAPEAEFELKINNKSLQRLEINLFPISPGEDDKDISELILVVMLYRMVDVFDARAVEWLNADTVLSVTQFLEAFTNISPRRVRGRQEILDAEDAAFHSMEEAGQIRVGRVGSFSGYSAHDGEFGLIDITDSEALSLAYRFCPRPGQIDEATPEEQAEGDIRRLATWGMTGMIGFLSAPVALSMVAVNLVRGEDFRLNTSVLSLTGLLVMLQSTGALANVVSYLPL